MALIKGKREICSYVGVNHNNFLEFKINHNLPAWRESDKGMWKALDYDLDEWLDGRAKFHLGREITSCQQPISNNIEPSPTKSNQDANSRKAVL